MRNFRQLIYYATALLFLGFGIISCSDDDGWSPSTEKVPFDPSKEIVLTDFTPKEGAVRTLVFLEGENFGTDISRINVYIGGQPASVISSDGKTIVVMVPRRANEGSITIVMLNEDGTVFQEYTYDEKIEIEISTQVGTLVGKRDPANPLLTSRIDGPFEEVEFQGPWWLELTRNNLGEKVLLVHDGRAEQETATGGTNDAGHFRSLREVNLETQMVRTLFTQGQAGIRQGLSIAMDPTQDTLFAMNDSGKANWNDRHALPSIYYAIRSEEFSKPRPYQYSVLTYSAIWFSDGSFFLNTYTGYMLYKGRQDYQEDVGIWDPAPLFSTYVATSSGHQYMRIHPTENYIYVTGNTHGVRRVPYDKESQMLLNDVRLVAGSASGGSGYAPGTGSVARFNATRQGVFVRNEEYENRPDGERYDFYMCDQKNHCIWKVTPEGTASLFAGRGSQGLNTKIEGYVDGDAIKLAQFYQPVGLAYDEETRIFYVADRGNRRIRTIAVE